MCCAIDEWFETDHVPLYKYLEIFHEAILNQGVIVIGCRLTFNRKITHHRLEHQGNTKTLSGQVRMGYIWGISIVETCLQVQIMIDICKKGMKKCMARRKYQSKKLGKPR